MTREEVKQIVGCYYTRTFKATLENGNTTILRMFIDKYGRIGVLDKGKKVYGHVLFSSCSYPQEDYTKWVSLTEVKKNETDKFSLFMRRANKAVEMLEESGLWEDIKENIKYFLSLDENEQREMVCDITSDFYKNFYEQTYGDGKYSWVNCYQVFASFAHKRCWKSIAWSKYARTTRTNEVKQAIANKKNFSVKWRNGYDNSVEISLGEDGKLRGWYSEEFYGCGNGHYYLLFDKSHAIFYEDD